MVMEVVQRGDPRYLGQSRPTSRHFLEKWAPFANHKSLDGAKVTKSASYLLWNDLTQDSVWRKPVERGDRAPLLKSEGAGIG